MGKKSNRKKKRQMPVIHEQKSKWSVSNIICLVLVVVTIGWMVKFVLELSRLKNEGVCIKAVIIKDKKTHRQGPDTYQYRFVLGNELYTGDSRITSRDRIGDSICVVYLPSMPAFHRAVSFLGEENVRCNCNASAR